MSFARVAGIIRSMASTRWRIGISVTLPTWGRRPGGKMPDNSALVDAILEGWHKCLKEPYGDGDFTPEDGVTDCNRFTNCVAEKMGCTDLKGLVANQIFAFLSNDAPGWSKVTGFAAAEYANQGCLVVAAWRNPNPKASGHVAVVRPGRPVTSTKWKHATPGVPMVANVGPADRCRLDRGANWAFGEEPSYFVWKRAGAA